MAVKKSNRRGQSAGKTSDRISIIPEKLGYYLTGFTDGEGSFNVSFIKRSDYKHRWKISLSFNITQKDDTIPYLFRDTMRCGTIRYRKDGICYFEVRRIKDIVQIIIPFFKRFPLLSRGKKNVFNIFCRIAWIVEDKKHLEKEGIREILKLRDSIKVSRKRKYSKREILKSY